ncbi:MAG: ribonuclease E/G [Beijerinckiaceae bacterium]
MATNRMLIDASHPEETRVVVQRGNRIDEFDFESALRKQLRGNIYLAKVTRVEPSLQAAFVEYGGNRHGFLAFSEIHPDYYQIPVADRQALLEEEARFAESEEEEEGEQNRSDKGSEKGGRRGRRRRGAKPRTAENGETVSQIAPAEGDEGLVEGPDSAPPEADTSGAEHAADAPELTDNSGADATDEHDSEDAEREAEEAQVEQIGGSDAMEDMREQRKSFRPRKQYKIQEVIKRRQILLVQVVKEERGNKGAALTTYLSLAGRYSVLMPNTARGGGISRKITNSADRRRLKELSTDLEVPDGMGVILRTAGASRTIPEIKRDFEYLLRVWEQVRETTLQSVAPMLVYEEGSLIKRSLRDLFGKEVDEVLVSGDAGYKEAREFMKMLMPSQVKAIKAHREPQPLYARYGIESQLDAMFSTNVTLKSGGYIVINPTEALVSIDVNSGRSTREHNIEDTALKTNLEAAEEVARQLRLRDLAGLIVIDFIDMEEHRNNRTVEKKLKDCLKSDRARIQVGRISAFGLMEMSRQRMRTGVLESSTIVCPHCGGSGFVRATSSVALLVLRGVEEALLKSAQFHITIKTRTEVALYILNQKRLALREIEQRFGVIITIAADDSLHGSNYYTLERGEAAPEGGLRTEAPAAPVDDPEDDFVYDEIEEEVVQTAPEAEDGEPRNDGDRNDEAGGRRGRRRRRGRGRDREERGPREQSTGLQDGDSARVSTTNVDADDADPDSNADAAAPRSEGLEGDDENRRRRRRGRRGGRRNRRDGESFGDNAPGNVTAENEMSAQSAADPVLMPVETGIEAAEPVQTVADDAPAPKTRGRRKAAVAAMETPAVEEAVVESKPKKATGKAAVGKKATGKTATGKTKVDKAEAANADTVETLMPVSTPSVETVAAPEQKSAIAKAAPRPEVVIEPDVVDESRPKRSGWWSKAKKALAGE